MIAYASRTGTKRNLAALSKVRWRLMVSARGALRTEGFRYAVDNGAWTASEEFRKCRRANADPCLKSFHKAVDKLGAGADFIVIPDIVMGGARSWALSRAYLRRLRRDPRLKHVKLLIAVQNGFTPWQLAPYLNKRVGIFVGGDTEWKLNTMAAWAALARLFGAVCHVGRVNTPKRIHLCAAAAVDSFDGSGWARYAVTIPAGELARQQTDIEGHLARIAA